GTRKLIIRRGLQAILFMMLAFILAGCTVLDFVEEEFLSASQGGAVTPLEQLERTDVFRSGALEHILEGELNHRGEAVGFHYNRLPTRKGQIITGSKTTPNEFGVYEAKVLVQEVEKTSNRGMSTFFPDEWDTQDVIDAI